MSSNCTFMQLLYPQHTNTQIIDFQVTMSFFLKIHLILTSHSAKSHEWIHTEWIKGVETKELLTSRSMLSPLYEQLNYLPPSLSPRVMPLLPSLFTNGVVHAASYYFYLAKPPLMNISAICYKRTWFTGRKSLNYLYNDSGLYPLMAISNILCFDKLAGKGN